MCLDMSVYYCTNTVSGPAKKCVARRHDTVNTMPQKAGRGNRAILRKAPDRGYIKAMLCRVLYYNPH